ANAAAKPAKPALGNAQTVARRDPKPERARPPEAKPRVEAKVEPHALERRAEELLQTRPANSNASAPAAAPAPVAQAPAGNEPGLLPQTFKKVTAWLLPSRDRMPVPDASAARPPMPVHEFQSNAM